MRVLFMPAPAIGHAFPMVPLAWAFRSAGHDTVFVTAGDGLTVGQAGLAALNALPGRTTMDMLSGFVRDVPGLFAPVRGEGPVEAMNKRKPLAMAAWDPYVDAHVALAEQTDPELVIYDPIFGVGPLVAAKLGVPAIAHAVSLARYSPEMLRELPAAVAFHRHGVRVPDGIRTLDVAPPSLAEGPASVLAMRFVPYNGGAVLPDWLLTPPERPRVAVTFGSLDRAGGMDSVARIADAAAKADAEFVFTLGDASAEVPSRFAGRYIGRIGRDDVETVSLGPFQGIASLDAHGKPPQRCIDARRENRLPGDVDYGDATGTRPNRRYCKSSSTRTDVQTRQPFRIPATAMLPPRDAYRPAVGTHLEFSATAHQGCTSRTRRQTHTDITTTGPDRGRSCVHPHSPPVRRRTGLPFSGDARP